MSVKRSKFGKNTLKIRKVLKNFGSDSLELEKVMEKIMESHGM